MMKRIVFIALALAVAIGLNLKPAGFGTAPAQPATALAATCPYSPTVKPTVSVDNSTTTTFKPGDTVTIHGSDYQCNARLTLTISAAGQTTSLPYVQLTTSSGGSFQTTYTIPSGPFTNPYPFEVKVFDVYANLLTAVTLHACQEAGGTSTASCGPQTLIQDAANYHTLQPLEQNAEQEIAGLRGIANDTTNVYSSRGEIRADMLVHLVDMVSACGPSMSTCPSSSDQAIVQYYANAVKQERVDVATLAFELDNGPNGNIDQSFCLPEQPSSCGWYSWHHNASSFLIPVGTKATECGPALNCGPDSSDSDQTDWTKGNGVLPPSFKDFTEWAAAAITEVQMSNWAQVLMHRDHSYTSQDAAVTQIRKEFSDDLAGFQEGNAYLVSKYSTSTNPPVNTVTLTPAEQNLEVAWKELLAAEGEKLTEPLMEMIAAIIEFVVEGAGEAAVEAGVYAGIIVVAVIGTLIGIFVSEQETSCALGDVLYHAKNDSLYDIMTGQASYSDCAGNKISVSKNEGLALLFGALMGSTMPDFEQLQYEPAPSPQPSDPTFTFFEGSKGQSATDLGLSNWADGDVVGGSTVSVANGWFIVNGHYQPDFEYKAYGHGGLYRAWLDGGHSFLVEAAAYNAGSGELANTINGGCPGQLVWGYNDIEHNNCIVSENSEPGCGPWAWCFNIVKNDEIMYGDMPSEQDGRDPGTATTVSYVQGPNSFFNTHGGLIVNPALTNIGFGSKRQVYVLTQPTNDCATSSSLPQGYSGIVDCSITSALLPESTGKCDPNTYQYTWLPQRCGVPSDQIPFHVYTHWVEATDDTYSLDSSSHVVTGASPYNGVLANDGPSTQDQQWLQKLDMPAGNVQLSVVVGPGNGTLNTNVSGSPFSTTGVFQYTYNPNAGSGGPSCIQIPVPATTSPGYRLCGGATGTPDVADSFIYKLCYSVIDWQTARKSPAVCSYARVLITGTVPTITLPSPGSKTYGDASFAVTATSNSPATITYSTGSSSVGCTVDPTSGMVTITGAAIGNNYCVITASQPASGSFVGGSVTQHFHISQAPLQVTASHTDLTYGDPAPTSFTFSYSGFVNGDAQTSVIGSNAPSCTTTYQQGDDVGIYPINCTVGTLSSQNYNYVSGYGSTSGTALSGTSVQLGPLTVSPAKLTVTAPSPSVDYSDAIPALTPTITGYVHGDGPGIFAAIPTCATSATTTSAPGPYTVTCTDGTLTSAAAKDYVLDYVPGTLTIGKEDVHLAYTGATTSDYHDAVTVSAKLTDPADTAEGEASDSPIAAKTVTFTLDGTNTCSGTTSSDGSVSCSLTPSEAAGSYNIVASFAGDTDYVSASDTSAFQVTLEQDTLTSSTTLHVLPTGQSDQLSATLEEDGSTPIVGRQLTMTLGTGSEAVSCTGTTHSTGTASCTVTPGSALLGPQSITDSFTSDGYYESATNAEKAMVFAFPSGGAFVIGDKTAASATPTTQVTWWGAQWWRLNSVTNGPNTGSFKGFADNINPTTPACGGTWTTATGNSLAPPSTVPSYMGVIVTSDLGQTGNKYSGTIRKIVVVRTDPGYQPDPAYPGTGTIAATYCP